MPVARFEMQDGRVARFEVPEGTTPEQAQTMMQAELPKLQKTPAWTAGDSASALVAPIEAAQSMGTGMAASALGGLAGIATGIGNLTGLTDASPSDVVRNTQEALTYRPRGRVGEAVTNAINWPMEKATEGIGMLGGMAGRAIGGERGGYAGQAIGETAFQTGALLSGRPLSMAAKAIEKPPIAGRDYSPLRDLKPEESARMKQQQDVGLQPTLGSVTRSPEQVRFENQTAGTTSGAKLEQRNMDNNAALLKAVENVDKKIAGKPSAENPRQAGESLFNAVQKAEQSSMGGVDALYNKARQSGETKAVIDIAPLRTFLAEQAHAKLSVPQLNSIEAALNKLTNIDNADVVAALKKGQEPAQGGVTRRGAQERLDAQTAALAKNKVTLEGAEALYRKASELYGNDPAGNRALRQVREIINEVTDGAGGDLYRTARQARMEHALQFVDRRAIDSIIAKKPQSRTDYKTDKEALTRDVLTGSLSDMKDVVELLKKNKTPESAQALRELQHQAIDQLQSGATRSLPTNKAADKNFSLAGYTQELKNISRDNAVYLLGEEAVKRLEAVKTAATDTLTPPGSVRGSETMLNAKVNAARQARIDAAQHLASAFGLGGKAAAAMVWAARKGFDVSAKKMQQLTEAGMIDEALNPNMASAETVAAMSAKERAAYNKAVKARSSAAMMRNLPPLGAVGNRRDQLQPPP